MESFYRSCENHLTYPQNLVAQDLPTHTLQAHYDRLEKRSELLFDEHEAAVDFWDLKRGENDYQPNCINDLNSMKQFLREALLRASSDPDCRYMFLSAPHSRAALRISAAMFKFLLSYHQIMPAFLDFVFPFGEQILPQDVHFSGLREDSRLDDYIDNTALSQLGRSGNALQLCYNLRSVEPSNDQSLLPWSIRQAAVCHQFDVKTGTTTWIIVKANKLLKNRIVEATSRSCSRPSKLSEAFSATLSAHLLMCEWAGENWRWYFNDLEKQFQDLTAGVYKTQTEKESIPSSPESSHGFSMSPRSRTSSFPLLSRSTTICNSPLGSPNAKSTPYVPSPPSRIGTIQDLASNGRNVPVAHRTNGSDEVKEDASCNNSEYHPVKYIPPAQQLVKASLIKVQAWARNTWSDRPSTPQPEPSQASPVPNEEYGPQEYPPEKSEQNSNETHDEFSFLDLQRIQYIEEKAQETYLVIGSNVQILTDLRQHYKTLIDNEGFPVDLKRDCQRNLSRFDRCVRGIEKDLQMLQARIQNLQERLANRKDMVNGILQHRSVKTSADFAKRAQQSADHMERMTREMHEIAKKTKQETVSMRVITTVTLFFLPATFIATFMSTDILKFEHGEKDFQAKGLGLYLAIALPLTVLTFVAWYVIYRLAKRGDLQRHTDASDEMA